MISHMTPGRIRLRHAAPLTQAALEALARHIRSVAPSAVLKHTPQTSGTLVLFDEKELSSRVLALFTSGEKVSRPANLPARCWPPMRQIKRGMAVSLLAFLGLLVVRREGAHAAMGGVFLSLLARHLWVYRKRIWK
jgi:hypothetical protein